jgi:hypothetical protein
MLVEVGALKNTHHAAIGTGVAVAVLLAVAFSYPAINDTLTNTPMRQPAESGTDVGAGMYRINTDCELIYGLSYGTYPDGEKLPALKIVDLIEEYPQEFAPWKETLEDPVKSTAFFSQPLPGDFGSVLVTAMMEESSINPDLKDTAMLIVDPNGKQKVAEKFVEFNCQPYFDSIRN